MNYSRFITGLSLARQESPIRKLTNMFAAAPPPFMLAGGMPNVSLFPFQDATISLRNGSELKITQASMEKALQYGPTAGFPPLVSQLKDFQQRLHSPPMWGRKPEEGGTDLIITTGSQDALSKSIDMLISPGDYVLLQEPVYAATITALKPLNPKLLPVSEDDEGIIPTKLREALRQWTPSECRARSTGVPKVLYLVPNGNNPSGTTVSLERRKEVYKIAQEYDLLILEDDPYYFLQFSEEFLPSFLSLDVDGRVLRFDSVSKILSGGMRVGFATGPQPLIERLNLHMQVSVLHCSSLSQVIISALLNSWGFDGFIAHVHSVRGFYQRQCEHMANSATKWLSGLAEWNIPQGGMFMWFKILGVEDSFKLIAQRALNSGVVLLPGNAFFFSVPQTPYVRAAFSVMSPEKIDQAFKLLAELIREEIKEMQEK